MKLVKRDEILANEGDTDNTIFILIRGTVGIFKGNVEVTRFCEKGTIIGEMSMILNSPRTATIKAIEDSYVVTIKGTLEQIIQKFPDVTSNIITNLAERLMKTTEGYCTVSEKLVDIMDDGYSYDDTRNKENIMKSFTDYMWFKTSEEKEIINITENLEAVIAHCGIDEGLANLFVMDSESGLIITNQNIKAVKDIERFLYEKVDTNRTYEFKNEDTLLAGAHIRKTLLLNDTSIPITKGKMEMGKNQNIYYIELNGKKRKRLTIKILGI